MTSPTDKEAGETDESKPRPRPSDPSDRLGARRHTREQMDKLGAQIEASLKEPWGPGTQLRWESL